MERHSAFGVQGNIVFDETILATEPWGRIIPSGDILRLIDLEGQQAVDFLCYDASNVADRYNSMNTIKVQGNIYIGKGTILYSDSGQPLFTVIEDTLGRHDTVYGCCSPPNNRLRYGKEGAKTCYANFEKILAEFGLDRSAIVGNINFFMKVPINPDGSAAVASDVSPAGSFVDLKAERDVLAVLSNCPSILNPCNGYNPTPIRVLSWTPA
jgi:urea carboxylase-associated protein 1